MFCRETVKDLRHVSQTVPGYPPILFFFQGNTQEGRAFFDKLWPEARAVSDSALRFYGAFGLTRGGLRQMFGPEVWLRGAEAALKGHTVGVPVGDPWIMPGAFLIHQQTILWQHTFNHAGDHPDWPKLMQYLPADPNITTEEP